MNHGRYFNTSGPNIPAQPYTLMRPELVAKGLQGPGAAALRGAVVVFRNAYGQALSLPRLTSRLGSSQGKNQA